MRKAWRWEQTDDVFSVVRKFCNVLNHHCRISLREQIKDIE